MRKTQRLQLPYFVREQFPDQEQFLERTEQRIEGEHLTLLKEYCILGDLESCRTFVGGWINITLFHLKEFLSTFSWSWIFWSVIAAVFFCFLKNKLLDATEYLQDFVGDVELDIMSM